MHIRWTQRRKVRLLVWLLLLPALACRIVVPPGFMPGTSTGHGFSVQMCHGAGPMPMGTSHDGATRSPAPGVGTHHESPCVFAAVGSAAPPPVVLAVATGIALPVAQPLVQEAVVVHRTTYGAHQARAPPSLSDPA